jgi:hypothetical protein
MPPDCIYEMPKNSLPTFQLIDNYIVGSEFSAAAGLKSGQFDRKKKHMNVGQRNSKQKKNSKCIF